MKNIHVLATDKPSNGYILGKCIKELSDVKIGQFTKTYHLMFSEEYFQPHNIYITSDEEIKVGEWVIYTKGIKIHCKKLDNKEDVELANIENSGVLKIILTTDQDLILDGVQDIKDEFIEWFVKNPSCEEVEVEMNQGRYYDYGGNVHITNAYKIIIPKEELDYTALLQPVGTKQETLEEVAINWWQNKQIIQQQGLCNIYLPNSFYLSLKKNEIIFIFNEEHKL
jgi:hypothetical protein